MPTLGTRIMDWDRQVAFAVELDGHFGIQGIDLPMDRSGYRRGAPRNGRLAPLRARVNLMPARGSTRIVGLRCCSASGYRFSG